MEKLMLALFFFGLCLYFFHIPVPYLEPAIGVVALIRGVLALRS